MEETVPLLNPFPGISSREAAVDPYNQYRFQKLVYYILIYTVIAPLHLVLSAVFWMLIYPLPLSKFLFHLLHYLVKYPLGIRAALRRDEPRPSSVLSIRSVPTAGVWGSTHHPHHERSPARFSSFEPTRTVSGITDPALYDHDSLFPTLPIILLCLHSALPKHPSYAFKYTVAGINIVFINLIPLVILSLLLPYTGLHKVSPTTHFVTCLLSIIPLAYFIGHSVSSITAQTGSLAVGAVINATFGRIIELILYYFSLVHSPAKPKLVEGSIVGSILCGLLLLPGCSMICGGLFSKQGKKEQLFNARSAGVSGAMLVVGVVGCFTPTVFQVLFGGGFSPAGGLENDPVFQARTRPLMFFCATVLIVIYAVGLVFMLGSHRGVIYPRHRSRSRIRKSKMINGNGVGNRASMPDSVATTTHAIADDQTAPTSPIVPTTPVGTAPRRERDRYTRGGLVISTDLGTSGVFTRGFTGAASPLSSFHASPLIHNLDTQQHQEQLETPNHGASWPLIPSILMLLLCTIAFSLLAESLITSLDSIPSSPASRKISEKFLGLTLFALVPSISEFYNAIAFAIHDHIALSMEIAFAYVVQVALVQVPILVFVSAYLPSSISHPASSLSPAISDSIPIDHPFYLLFSAWDFYACLIGVFLVTYVFNEGVSNYFKGGVLVGVYAILIGGSWFVPGT